MIRFAVTFSMIVVLGLSACSGSDSGGGTGTDPGTAPVSAKGGAAPTSPSPDLTAKPSDPQIQGCLDLVVEQRFAEAVPACTAALRSHPGNAELEGALNEAQAGVAKLADAQGTAGGATGDAQDTAAGAASDAAGAAQDAAGGIPKLGQ